MKIFLAACVVFALVLSVSASSAYAIGQVDGLHFIGQVDSSFTGTVGLDGPGGQSADCTFVSGVLQGSPCEVLPGVNEGVWTISASGTGTFGLTVAFCKVDFGSPSGICEVVLGGYSTFASLDFCGGSSDLCTGSFTGQFTVNDSCNTTPVGCLVPVTSSPVPEFSLGLTVLVALGLPIVLLARRFQRRLGP